MTLRNKTCSVNHSMPMSCQMIVAHKDNPIRKVFYFECVYIYYKAEIFYPNRDVILNSFNIDMDQI